MGLHLRRRVDRDGAHPPVTREDRGAPVDTAAPRDGRGPGIPVGRMNGIRRVAVAVAIAGTAATVATVMTASMSLRDALHLVALGASTALVGVVASVVALQCTRRRTIALQVIVLSTCTLATVALGAWVGARAMFISAHDLRVLVILLVVAGTVGVLAALVLGDRIGQARLALINAARRIGEGEAAGIAVSADETTDMASLARELELTSERLAEARRRERAVDASRR